MNMILFTTKTPITPADLATLAEEPNILWIHADTAVGQHQAVQ